MLQKISIKTSTENPFDEHFIEIDLQNGEKILSNESYVKELYELYSGTIKDTKSFTEIENQIAECTISEIKNNIAQIELNKKYSTIIDLKREKKDLLSYIQPGNIINLKVTNTKKHGYNVSFTNAVNDLKIKEIMDSIGKSVAFLADVKELVFGGYYLVIDGIKVFMPGSLGGMNKLINFEDLIGKKIYVCPINFSDQFNMIVVSHREYLKQLKPIELDKVRYDIEYTGKITGTNKYGIFAEFNCDSDMAKPLLLTGLIPTSEMNDVTLKMFNCNSFTNGDIIKFYVKTISDENGDKIILSKFFIDWDQIQKDYKQGKDVKCKVIKIQDKILFAQIDNLQIVGSINNYDGVANVDDIIDLKISKIDMQSRKVFLKQ